MRPAKERYKIVIESQAFPSDRYAATSQLRLHGFDADEGLLKWSPRDGENRLHTEDLADNFLSEPPPPAYRH